MHLESVWRPLSRRVISGAQSVQRERRPMEDKCEEKELAGAVSRDTTGAEEKEREKEKDQKQE